MHKKLISVTLALLLTLSLSSCSPKNEAVEKSFDSFTNAIDTGFSQSVMESLAALGDDPDTGNRSAGSPAEQQAAEYLFDTMKDIGLSNVTMDEGTVDGWTYKGANVTYQDESGQDVKIVLGGYATTLVAKNETCQMVYLGRGTDADYEGVDVTDKLVLVDIDQNNEWWINYPAYQAKVKGAKAIIAMSILEESDPNRISSQDICGPDTAPAFAISETDSKTLQQLMANSENGEITVRFQADSKVKSGSTTHNVWGEIPGKSDEVIYLLGHYDGYYHSTYDDASGVATSLGIVKAMLDSGYVPDKTIRVVAHGAEEFGRIDSAYDWSAGAYQQIVINHPEWAEKAFAIVNIDGCYPISGETNFGISASSELGAFAQDSVGELIQASGYQFSWTMPAGCWTEDFMWTRMGIPSIVAGEHEDGRYSKSYYHSSTDSVDAAGFDPDTFRFNHELFGKMVLDLDNLAVRPMNFADRFTLMEGSIDSGVINDSQFAESVKAAIASAEKLNDKINDINESYAEAMAKTTDEDPEKADEAKAEAAAIKEEATALNVELFVVYKTIQDSFNRLDWGLNLVFPHENCQANVNHLQAAITALEAGDVVSAYDNNLWAIDYAWYATAFDQETYDYFVEQIYHGSENTFGEGMIEYPCADMYRVMRSLGEKYEVTNPNTTEEVALLKAELVKQQGYVADSVAKEKTALADIISKMDALTQEK